MPTNRYEVTLDPDTSIQAKPGFLTILVFLLLIISQSLNELFSGSVFILRSRLEPTGKAKIFKPLAGGNSYDWKSKIEVMTLSPLVAWKISNRLSLGATFI